MGGRFDLLEAALFATGVIVMVGGVLGVVLAGWSAHHAVLGFCFLGLGFVLPRIIRMGRWTEVRARIYRVERGDPDTCHFEYYVDGRRHVGAVSETTTKAVGDEWRVFYNPADPAAHFTTSPLLFILGGLFIVVGLFVGLGGLGAMH